MQRIAEFETQYETLLSQLPESVQALVKSRQKDAASVEGNSVLALHAHAPRSPVQDAGD